MASRRVYAADREVIDACRDAGMEVTARQLERWRAAGCLPPRPIDHTEGIRGSRSVNPPGYVEQVQGVVDTVKAGIPLQEAPLALFAKGFPIQLDMLRRAYLQLFIGIRDRFEALPPPAGVVISAPEDRADALAREAARRRGRGITRRWQIRAHQAAKQHRNNDARALFEDVLSAAFTGLTTGQPVSSQGIVEALTVIGLNAGQDPEQVAARLAATNLDALIEAIRSAEMEQWIVARHDLGDLVCYAEMRRRVEARVLSPSQLLPGLGDLSLADPISQAALIPALLVMADDEWRLNLQTELAQLQALDQLLSALPGEYHRYLHQDRIAEFRQQPAEFQSQFVALLSEWAIRNPGEATTLNLQPPAT